MRPIDADRLNKCFEIREEDKDDFSFSNLTKLIREIVDNQPTIESEPVVHGEWLKCYREEHKRCSNCDVIAFIGLYPNGNANYCPNCGSKNREVE